MGYVIKVNGMKVRSCRSFEEAKAFAKLHNGKVYTYTKAKLPQAAMLRFNDPTYIKREMYHEIYSEENRGYHCARREKKWE